MAEDLLASGSEGVATLEVAVLSRTSLRSDAEPLVRAMLAEHGIDVPVTGDERSDYRVLLHAFAYWDLPIHHFEGPFYVRIPDWRNQGPLDRALVTMLDQRDHVTSPMERDALVREMRAVARKHLAAKT